MTEQAATDAIDKALAVWRQGDCVVGEQWFVFRQSEGEDGLSEVQVEGLVVVSQTCDVVRTSADRPFVEVAPLVKVPEGQLVGIRRGRMLRYAFVPGVADQALVADLERTMTVHKELVATWTRVEGCKTDADGRVFAEMLARKRRRFAFPDDFTELVRPFQERFKDKHEKKTPEGEAMRALLEIRVQARPSWAANSIALDFFMVCDEATKQAIGKEMPAWRLLVKPRAPYEEVNFVGVTLDELTAAQYLATDPLDLEYLSWSGS